jgi:hypothetical protein
MNMHGIDPFSPGSKPTKPAGPGNPRTDFGIAGIIGAELSTPLHTLRRGVQALGDSGRLSAKKVHELEQALELASLIVRQSQQLARLSEGRLRQSHERVSLDQMLQSALHERQSDFQARGIQIAQAIMPVEIVVDPGLLSNLVDTAIECAMDNSVQITISLTTSAWPEHGLLAIAARCNAAPQEPGRNGTASPSLGWHLLSQIARTMGVTLSRNTQGSETTLRLEFARTVKHLEGLTSMEIESSSGDSALHTGTKALAGLRILLISTDAAVRGEVEKACRALGLRADTVSTSAKAVRYTERDQPHMIIVDERLRDSEFDALMQDIRRLDPSFGFLEVTDSMDTFEVASWAGDSITRVSRNALRAQLPAVLTLELAKAF